MIDYNSEQARKTINDLAAQINAINRANGWDMLIPENWDSKFRIPSCIALIHSEASEALEAFRKSDRANFEEELADVIIRTLDLAGGLGIDIADQIARKLDKNKTRGYRHGGKRV